LQLSFTFKVTGGRLVEHSTNGSDRSGTTITYKGGKLSAVCAKELPLFGDITSPGWWINFPAANSGVKSVHELGTMKLSLPNELKDCTVIEVEYDDFNNKIRNTSETVRYWFDPNSMLVRRVDFSEPSRIGDRRWTATVDRVSISEDAVSSQPYRLLRLVGSTLATSIFKTSDGQSVDLHSLRGKTVALAFWATWCLPCETEIPALENLQSEQANRSFVVIGVTDEDAVVVNEWKKKYGRAFRSIVSGADLFDQTQTPAIPALVVIDEQGTVRNFTVGFMSESRVRQIIEEVQQAVRNK
jgi:thiol-disulfide isomerase/thioredoxin